MNTIAQVSGELRGALQRLPLRQADLREAAGVSRQTLANVLSGKEDYKLSTLLALADKLGLELLLMPKGAAAGLRPTAEAPVVESVVDRALKGLSGAGGIS